MKHLFIRKEGPKFKGKKNIKAGGLKSDHVRQIDVPKDLLSEYLVVI